MNSSDLIEIKDNRPAASISNGKSVKTVVVVGGKKYFKKQLTERCKDNLCHRMAMYKEFDVGRQINCPYIVKYIGINEDEHGMYVLQEHINGKSITEKIETEPSYFCNHRNTTKMLRQLLEALRVLHESNIAYLDLKPENIMLQQINNNVKLTDLGGCFADSNNYTAEYTRRYAAPELIEKRLDDVDARTDIYGVGKLLEYIEKKTGKKLPKHLERIMRRCLQEDKTLRYGTVNEVIKALEMGGVILRTFIFCMAMLCALIFGWKQFEGSENHKRLMTYLRTDATVDGIHYMVTSEDSATCMVIGAEMIQDANWGYINLYIRDKIEIGGKAYRITEIEDSAFKSSKIASVSFPNSLTRIGNEAFMDCPLLGTISLPASLKSTEHACFKRTGVRNILFPEGIKTIGHASFAESRDLTSVVIPEGVETLELDAFACCDNLVKVEMPSTLKTICRGVFWECRKLKEICIPAGVTGIGEYTFFHCDSLTDVYNYSPEPQALAAIFNRRDINVHVPEASAEKYRNAHHWGDMNIIGDL
ncbi:MAG: leucine-rich repeat protein [Bacteroidaceae bacterium]|nr:leucine-rich repeat protein [Bacteroidaceae bacterium]